MAQDPSNDASMPEAGDANSTLEDSARGASSQTKLPQLNMGDVERTSTLPLRRTKPGRVSPRIVMYPIYLAVAAHAAFSARFASMGLEWNTGVVLLGALMIFGWNWMYSVSWSYKRVGLQLVSAVGALGLEIAVLVWTLDRARAQQAATDAGLTLRAASPELYVSSGALAVAIVLLLSHIVYLGRGNRERSK